MNDHGCINYVPNPPHYQKLRYFEWVDDYLALEEAKKEIKNIGSQIERIRSTASPKESILANFKESFERYERRRIEKLAKLLQGLQRRRDPFSNIEHRLPKRPNHQRAAGYLSWSDVEAALELVEFSDEVLSDAEKEKQIAPLRKSIEKLKSRIKECSPPGYFLIRQGEIQSDSREDFVQHWFKIQGTCNAPCTPHGFDLETGTDAEREAYRKLGLSGAINSRRYTPSPHPRYEKVNNHEANYPRY